MTDLGTLLHLAHEAVDVARRIADKMPAGRVERKGDRDYASQVDLAVERTVRAFLADRTSGIAFLGEEDGLSGIAEGGLSWILDPLDGTSNFVHGLPLYGISLGLVRDTTPILGVIDFPRFDERFSAAEGHGAFLGKQPITCSATETLRDAIVSIGDYAVGDDAAASNHDRLSLTRSLAESVERVRMLGSAAIDLAWVACGRTDACITLSNNPWDMAAGVVLVREAGGHVVDLDGSQHTTKSAATIAAPPSLIADVLNRARYATDPGESP
ncbi:inositol monophosphatase family protein [Parafrankia irregularis]|uniref:inositol monophosphatase family protein n=1 Tax=Parafrankia irregularis TaxID=795642 RepID=UPI000B85C90B|nr:inositol monophosphatase family protein [Parafrankia irregularis]MBE3200319.1 inositol monophosphatase family protein [Parafrankia sp. CH37]